MPQCMRPCCCYGAAPQYLRPTCHIAFLTVVMTPRMCFAAPRSLVAAAKSDALLGGRLATVTPVDMRGSAQPASERCLHMGAVS
ncbi:hypothetical protein HaLaN_02396 [Haematococcus lacustris]|uniref:Uncharacterized protein n=1 Tax=Haematococcus lacustris TaxID=44745 RepID=A0A699YBM4_HAELA|nr:hypothetical protein HaLaN_02396 [Haematococcus lacustris]